MRDRGQPDLVDVGGGGRVQPRAARRQARHEDAGAEADGAAGGLRGDGAREARQPVAQEGQHAADRGSARARYHLNVREGLHPQREGVRLGVAVALLLEPEGRRHADQAVHRLLRLRLRVRGPQRPSGDHASDGPLLHDHHAGADLPPRLLARRPGRNGQDGDGEGPGQGHGHPVLRDQLRRGPGLQGHGIHLRRPDPGRRLGLLRRVQPHQHRGAVRGVGAAACAAELAQLLQGHVRPRRRRHQHQPYPVWPRALWHVHHHEPRLRRPHGAAGQPQGAVPAGDDDRAGPDADLPDLALQRGLRVRAHAGQEDDGAVQARQGAAVPPVPLRLGPARAQVRAGDGRLAQACLPRARRGPGADARAARCQHAQVRVRGRAALHGAAQRPVPRSGLPARGLPGAEGGHRRGARPTAVPLLGGGRVQLADRQDHPDVRDHARAPHHNDRRPHGWWKVRGAGHAGQSLARGAEREDPPVPAQPQGADRQRAVRLSPALIPSSLHARCTRLPTQSPM